MSDITSNSSVGDAADPIAGLGAGTNARPHATGRRRRVVLMAYYFPPMGGAGTQRAAAFARHLPTFGLDPVVVCAGEQEPGPCTIAHDATLLEGLPSTMPVTHIPALEGQRPTWRDRWNGRRLVASAAELAWARRAADAAVFAVRRHDAAATVVSVSPYACALHVAEIRLRTGRPVLLDLRDPWSLDGWRSFRTPMQRFVDRREMRASLRAADMVIANCPVAAAAYRALAGLPAERVTVIPNGYETDEFPARRRSVRQARPADPDAPFRIVHLGTLHDPDPRTARPARGRHFAGGTVDRSLRSARTLLMAAGRLRRERPDLADQLRIDFHGRVHPGHETLAEAEGVADLLTLHPYVDHKQVPGILSHADLVHVPLHAVPPGEEALCVPGKLYEAVASGRPVLATVPDGDARRLVRLAGGDGRVFGPADVAGVAGAIAAWIEGSRHGWRPEGAPRELLHPFSRRRLTERLSLAIAAAAGEAEAPADDPWIELATIVSQVDGGNALATIETHGTDAAATSDPENRNGGRQAA